jgi:glycosyltransferase involved in cell wall biosynthesis
MIPKVSVIMPVYNSAKYLNKTLDCLLKQTYKSIEFIIVDDSSTDSSFEIAKKYESATIKVLRQSNAGAAIARNTGLLHATGDYIQFMDADDYLSADKIEKQVIALNGSSDIVAVCNHLNFFNDQELGNIRYHNDQESFVFSTNDPVDFLLNLYGAYGQPNFVQTNSWLVPKYLIDKVGGWRNYRCPDDDGEFFARILLASSGIVYVPGVYNYYRRSVSSNALSQNRNYKYLHNTLLTIELKHSYLSKYVSGSKLDKAIAIQYLNFAVSVYPHNYKLFKIAYKKFKSLNVNIQPPVIGGKGIEILKTLIGWKNALQIKLFLNNLK